MLIRAEKWIEEEALVDMQKKVAKQEDLQEKNLCWQHVFQVPLSRREEKIIQKICCTEPIC